MAPYHSSQMLASNLTALLKTLVLNGSVSINFEDEIVRESLVTHQGKVFNARIAETIEKSASSLAGGQVVNS